MSETHWRQIHRRMNEHLLFAEDLGGRASVDLVIVDSGVGDVSDGSKKKPMPWIAFEGKKKRLALNVTNAKTLQTITGTGIIEQWRGPITLVVVKTKFKDQKTGEQMETDAIRIAPKRPRPHESDRPRVGRRATPEELAAEGAGAGPSDDWYDAEKKTTDEKTKGDGYTFDPDADKEQP